MFPCYFWKQSLLQLFPFYLYKSGVCWSRTGNYNRLYEGFSMSLFNSFSTKVERRRITFCEVLFSQITHVGGRTFTSVPVVSCL